MRRPLTVGAFTIPHSPALPLSEIPIEALLESPNPDKSLSDELTSLFTKNPATFYHGTHDFYTLKKNTQIPEICILGRSNVGKSTFVNALANRLSQELAHTSSKAGRTRAMNAFGFGPVPLERDLAATDDETKRTEELPKHTFFVVDMPGYGFRSLKDWGRNISLYLTKRKAVKGAILLIDGEVGPKKGDLQALEILEEAGLRTAVVLTKADKAKDEEMLRKTCKDMWLTMRNIIGRDPNSTWTYEKDFFVTALGATKKEIGVDSVAIARLAVARLAGLVKEKTRPGQEAAKGYSGKVVSFDELQYVANTAPEPPSESRTSVSTPISSLDSSNSAFTALERAAMDMHKARTSVGRLSTSASLRNANPRRVQARPIHTLPSRQQNVSPQTKQLQKILKEFTDSLTTEPTPRDRAKAAQAKLQRTKEAKPNAFWEPTRGRLRSSGKPPFDRKTEEEIKLVHGAILERRLRRDDMREKMAAEMGWRRAQEEEEMSHAVRDQNQRDGKMSNPEGAMGPDEFNDAWNQIDRVERERQLHGKKAKKSMKEGGKNKKIGKGDDELDGFSAKFAAAK
jgi:ribosome biogenesis GTP-binding protein YsxC/EngB